jgi:hypothetical protein
MQHAEKQLPQPVAHKFLRINDGNGCHTAEKKQNFFRVFRYPVLVPAVVFILCACLNAPEGVR